MLGGAKVVVLRVWAPPPGQERLLWNERTEPHPLRRIRSAVAATAGAINSDAATNSPRNVVARSAFTTAARPAMGVGLVLRAHLEREPVQLPDLTELTRARSPRALLTSAR
jgi:hypothetical protein